MVATALLRYDLIKVTIKRGLPLQPNRIKPKKENSQAVASKDSSKYAVATTGVAVGLLAGLVGFKKKKQSSKND